MTNDNNDFLNRMPVEWIAHMQSLQIGPNDPLFFLARVLRDIDVDLRQRKSDFHLIIAALDQAGCKIAEKFVTAHAEATKAQEAELRRLFDEEGKKLVKLMREESDKVIKNAEQAALRCEIAQRKTFWMVLGSAIVALLILARVL